MENETTLENNPKFGLPDDVRQIVDQMKTNFNRNEKEWCSLLKKPLPREGEKADSAEGKAEEVLKACDKEVIRRIKEFESNRFVVVTFGAVKAGKSTLINAFSGKEVSPIGQSIETTLRSSLILAADEQNPEGIYIVKPKIPRPVMEFPQQAGEDPSPAEQEEWKKKEAEWKKKLDEWRKECAKDLLNHLQGVVDKAEFKSLFDVEQHDFTTSNLEHYLAGREMAGEDVLPPVIRIDLETMTKGSREANLLSQKVILIDTPGLDGTLANVNNDPFLKILTEKGDCFFYVQSSMSALNRNCYEYLQSIYRAAREAKVVVVFNEVDSRFWEKGESKRPGMEKERGAAYHELEMKIQAMAASAPKPLRVNAGEAWAAIQDEFKEQYNKPQAEMLTESGIIELREELRKLSEDRIHLRVKNCRSRIREELARQEKALSEARSNLESQKRSLQTKFDDTKRKLENAYDAFKKDVCSRGLQNEFSKFIRKKLIAVFGDDWKNVVSGKAESCAGFEPKKRIEWNRFQPEFHKFCTECSSVAKKIVGQHFGNMDESFDEMTTDSPAAEAFFKANNTYFEDIQKSGMILVSLIKGGDIARNFAEEAKRRLCESVTKEILFFANFAPTAEELSPEVSWWHKRPLGTDVNNCASVMAERIKNAPELEIKEKLPSLPIEANLNQWANEVHEDVVKYEEYLNNQLKKDLEFPNRWIEAIDEMKTVLERVKTQANEIRS